MLFVLYKINNNKRQKHNLNSMKSKSAINAPRINLIGYGCCLEWQKSSVQYWTFMCRETLQKNKFWLRHLIIRSQALGRLRPERFIMVRSKLVVFFWVSTMAHKSPGCCTEDFCHFKQLTYPIIFLWETFSTT